MHLHSLQFTVTFSDLFVKSLKIYSYIRSDLQPKWQLRKQNMSKSVVEIWRNTIIH